jgi:hypothetical protein
MHSRPTTQPAKGSLQLRAPLTFHLPPRFLAFLAPVLRAFTARAVLARTSARCLPPQAPTFAAASRQNAAARPPLAHRRRRPRITRSLIYGTGIKIRRIPFVINEYKLLIYGKPPSMVLRSQMRRNEVKTRQFLTKSKAHSQEWLCYWCKCKVKIPTLWDARGGAPGGPHALRALRAKNGRYGARGEGEAIWRNYILSYACIRAAMSSLTIWSIAFMTRCDFWGSLSCSNLGKMDGTTCQVTPNLSVIMHLTQKQG